MHRRGDGRHPGRPSGGRVASIDGNPVGDVQEGTEHPAHDRAYARQDEQVSPAWWAPTPMAGQSRRDPDPAEREHLVRSPRTYSAAGDRRDEDGKGAGQKSKRRAQNVAGAEHEKVDRVEAADAF